MEKIISWFAFFILQIQNNLLWTQYNVYIDQKIIETHGWGPDGAFFSRSFRTRWKSECLHSSPTTSSLPRSLGVTHLLWVTISWAFSKFEFVQTLHKTSTRRLFAMKSLSFLNFFNLNKKSGHMDKIFIN